MRLWNNYVPANGLACICSTRRDEVKIYNTYKKQLVLHFERMGHKAPTICHLLREEGMRTSRVEIYKFLRKNRETKNIEQRPCLGWPTRMAMEVKALVEQKMRKTTKRNCHPATRYSGVKWLHSGLDFLRQCILFNNKAGE